MRGKNSPFIPALAHKTRHTMCWCGAPTFAPCSQTVQYSRCSAAVLYKPQVVRTLPDGLIQDATLFPFSHTKTCRAHDMCTYVYVWFFFCRHTEGSFIAFSFSAVRRIWCSTTSAGCLPACAHHARIVYGQLVNQELCLFPAQGAFVLSPLRVSHTVSESRLFSCCVPPFNQLFLFRGGSADCSSFYDVSYVL